MNKTLAVHIVRYISRFHCICNEVYFDNVKEYRIENDEIVINMPDVCIGIRFTSEEKCAEYTSAENIFDVAEDTYDTEKTILTVSVKSHVVPHIRQIKPTKVV